MIAALWGASAAAGAVEDFCFLQVSDLHVGPYARGNPKPGKADRSVREIAWFCEQAHRPQPLTAEGGTTPRPSFVIATGDLTEYGVIHATWDHFEAFFKPLDLPLYVSPGNHDNTWTNMQPIMRRRHGGDHYSFDRFGCHFVNINTATPQEPVPSLEQRTLTWLADDLREVAPETPVFIFCHHPLSSREFAYPIEQLQFLDVLEGHNVALLLMGHGHSARHERWSTLDSVMGGTTYNPRPNDPRAGYAIVSVVDGTLRVGYRHLSPDRGFNMVFTKPITPAKVPSLELIEPRQENVHGRKAIVATGASVRLRIRVANGAAESATASIDNEDNRKCELHGPNNNARKPVLTGNVDCSKLSPGWHYVRLQAAVGGYELDEAIPLLVPAPPSLRVAATRLSAGIKAAPLVLDDDNIVVATTAGTLEHISFAAAEPRRKHLLDTEVEILDAPAMRDGRLYVSAAENGVYCVGLDGDVLWRHDVGEAVIGTPALDDRSVYVGDLEGNVHRINRQSGEIEWSTHHADFSIEQPLTLHEGVLYFGAWDGFVYAVHTIDGKQKWKSRGPAGHLPETKYRSRYYAPADCAPIVLGDRIYVCDRSYRLGGYGLDGAFLGQLSAGVAAISPTANRDGFYARGSNEGLTCYDATGMQRWSHPLALGRFPAGVAATGRFVFACSNRGSVSCHDSTNGKALWTYEATPDLHVMAPVSCSTQDAVFVAGMDGTVTRIRGLFSP